MFLIFFRLQVKKSVSDETVRQDCQTTFYVSKRRFPGITLIWKNNIIEVFTFLDFTKFFVASG